MRLFILSTLIVVCHIVELYGQCTISVTCRPTPPKVECACEIDDINPLFIGTEAMGNEDVIAFEALGFTITSSGNCGKIFVTASDFPHHPTDCQDSFYLERVYSISSEFTGNRPTCVDTFHTEVVPAHFYEKSRQTIEISCEDNVDSLFQEFKDSLLYARFLDCNNNVRPAFQPASPVLAVEKNCNGGPGCGDEMHVRPLLKIFGPCHAKCLTIDREDSDQTIRGFCVKDDIPSIITCPTFNSTLDLSDARLEMKIDSIISEYDLTFGCTPPLINNNFHIDSVDFQSCAPQDLPITITAEEACSINSSDCTFSITIVNEQGPEIVSVPDTLFLECGVLTNLDSVRNWKAQVVAIDFKGGSLSSMDITDDFDTNVLSVSNCNSNYLITFTAADNCNRTSTKTSVIQIRDTQSPVITSCPSDTLLSADDPNLNNAVTLWLDQFTATDLCKPDFLKYNTFNPNWLSFSCGTIDTVIVFSADDTCAETPISTCEAKLIIEDNVTYEFSSFPNDTVIQCENPINASVLSAWTARAVGMSSLGVTYNLVSVDLDYMDPRLLSCNDVIDVTFSFENDCGVVISKIARLGITDDESPQITCPADQTFSGNFDDILPDITNWLGTALPVDNCSARAINFFDGIQFQDCDLDTITNPVQFYAQDECGNTSPPCSASLTLITDKDPLITCPERIILECGMDMLLDSIQNWSETAISTNFVGIDIDPTSSLDLSSINLVTCLEETMVTFTVNDTDCNRIKTCETSITIQDSQRPNITCPTTQLTINSNSTNINQEVNDWIATSVYDDNGCMIPDFFTDPPLDNIDFCNRTDRLEMTFKVVDMCLLERSCIGIINFNTNGPDVTCPSTTLTLECGQMDVISEIDDWLAEASAIDNAGTDLSSAVTNSFDPNVLETRCTLNIPVTFEVTDSCINPGSCQGNIQIVDTMQPEVDCPMTPLNLLAGDTTKIPKYLTWLELIPVTDCNDYTITDDFDESVLAGFDCDEINYNVNIRVEDNCGWITNCQAEISIQNNITTTFVNCDPSINNLTVECGATEMKDEIQLWMAEVTAIDLNNNPFPTDPSLDVDDPTLLQCGGTIPVTFELSDQCGVAQSCMLNLTINDTTAPEAFCPPDTSFVLENPDFDNLVQAWLDAISGEDACMTFLQYTDNYTAVTSLPNCVASLPITVQFFVDDGCSNVGDCTATLTVTTDQVPTISCPDNQVIECGDNNTDLIIADWLASVEGMDSGSNPIAPEYTFDINDVYDIQCGDIIPILFSIEDACNITDTCSASIIVEDTTPPEAVCPDQLTINSNDPTGSQRMQDWLDSYQPTDNCSMPIASIQNGIVVPSVFCNSPNEIAVAFYAEDACGMRDTCNTTIIVNTAAPTIDCQDDITVECGNTNNEQEILDWIDSFSGEDNHGTVLSPEHNFTSTTLSQECSISETITFTFRDNCGFETSCSREIVQADNQAPEITNCPPTTVINTGDTDMNAQISQWLNSYSAEDQCNTADVSNDYMLDVQPFDCEIGQTVTFLAKDECENVNDLCVSDISFINILDIDIICPQPITVICNDGQTLQRIIEFLQEWDVDSQDDDFEVSYDIDIETIDTDCSAQYIQDVIFTVVDKCGNTDECPSSIEFIPNARVYIPTIFSPSLGGDDASYTIRTNIAVSEIKTFKIYSRWGDLMYDRENFDPNIDEGWDGRDQRGNHVQGVYTYLIQYDDIFGNEFEKIGTITLL